MNIGAIKLGIIPLALLLLNSFCGCATHDAKENAGSTESQTAGSRQVIVVPIFILSPSGNATPGQ